ncbi:hypothetical protein QQS21_003675 [Conoideocrella luteorostrata]|uniref:Uncharacterized protein n=1 Tax=Conoideocrella luteorostrata TaxID=1105319 RepID=A0AAJ0CVE3_9HYPO|nr:hypothetical protein QQS21_003675 [Conoideocrella luteorostrata]
MGSASTKKAVSKQKRSPAKDRRTQTRTQIAKASLHPSTAPGSRNNVETPRTARYSHRLPTDRQRKGNGRCSGRSLIMWNRPRMAEKLLLHMQYECSRHKVQLPWDAIAHRLHPGSSGQAICQHINRLRRELVAEGHLVPPMPQKSAPTADPDIRGYIRKDIGGSDLETTRAVRFGERVDDPKFNLPDAMNLSDHADSDVVDMQDLGSSPIIGSKENPQLLESPTPVGRTSSRVLSGSPETQELISLDREDAEFRESTQDFLPLSLNSSDQEKAESHRPSPAMPTYYLRDNSLESEYKHRQQSAGMSDAGSSLVEDDAAAIRSFENDCIITDLDANAGLVSSLHYYGHMDSYRLPPPWAHQQYVYQPSTPQHISTPAASFEHGHYLTPAPMPMSAHFMYCAPNQSMMKPEASDDSVSSGQQVDPQVKEASQFADPFEQLWLGLKEGEGEVPNTEATLADVITTEDQ